MVADAFTAEDSGTTSLRGSQPLALGFAALAAGFLLLGAGVTLFGEAQDGEPVAALAFEGAAMPSPSDAHAEETPYAKSIGALDSTPSAASIDQQLSGLEARAWASGAAAASASAYPISIAHIKTWAATLSGRGFVLVPASAIVGRSK